MNSDGSLSLVEYVNSFPDMLESTTISKIYIVTRGCRPKVVNTFK